MAAPALRRLWPRAADRASVPSPYNHAAAQTAKYAAHANLLGAGGRHSAAGEDRISISPRCHDAAHVQRRSGEHSSHAAQWALKSTYPQFGRFANLPHFLHHCSSSASATIEAAAPSSERRLLGKAGFSVSIETGRRSSSMMRRFARKSWILQRGVDVVSSLKPAHAIARAHVCADSPFLLTAHHRKAGKRISTLFPRLGKHRTPRGELWPRTHVSRLWAICPPGMMLLRRLAINDRDDSAPQTAATRFCTRGRMHTRSRLD